MFCPALTGCGASESATERSACPATVVVAVAVLLPLVGSGVVEEIVVLALIVPVAAGSTSTTAVKLAEPPAANVARVTVTVPVAPTAGVVALHPAGVVTETNVVPAGVASVTDTVCASDGPALLAVIV